MRQTELTRKTPLLAKAKPKARKPMKKRKKGSVALWKKKCDGLASKIARLPGRCLVCGATKNLQAHHLIRRNCVFYRHDLRNLVCLCPGCHEYSIELSAHGAPWAFEEWMKANKPIRYAWWVEHRHHVITGTKMDYEAIHGDLLTIYEKDKTYDWTARTLGVDPWENDHAE